MMEAFVPPKPKLFESATLISRSRLTCGARSIGVSTEALAAWVDALGPIAIVDLETTGLPESRSAEILEIGVVLLDPGEAKVGVGQSLVRPRRGIPPLITRLTGLSDADVCLKSSNLMGFLKSG